MNKFITAAATATLVLLSSNAYCGYGHQGKMYTLLNLGYGVQDHQMDFTGAATGGLKNSGNGLLGQAGMGYYLLDELRVDLLVHYDRGFKFKKSGTLGATAVTARGKDISIGGFGNVYYDFLNSSNFTPYGMLGAGFLRTEYKATVNVAGTDGKENKGKYNFAYEAGLGLAYHAGQGVDIDLGYRYITMQQPEYKMTLTSPAVTINAQPDIIHAAIVGLRLTY